MASDLDLETGPSVASDSLDQPWSGEEPAAITTEKSVHSNPVYQAFRETCNNCEGPFNVFHANDADKRTAGEEPHSSRSKWRRYLNVIYPGYFFDHLDYESFKVVAVTFLQVWTTVILCVVPRTSRWFGNGNFLLQIMGFIIVSGGFSISLNVYKAFACTAYYLFSWMCALIAMAITASIRGGYSAEYYIHQLIQEGTCTPENASDCFEKEVYTGRYLETRTSVIWILMVFFAFVIMGFSHKYILLGRLPYVTGVIGIICNFAFSVFFPTFEPKGAGYILLRPMAVAFAFQIIASAVVFPFTSSRKLVKLSIGTFKKISELNDCNIRFLGSMKPAEDHFSSYEEFSKLVSTIRVSLPQADMFASSALYEVSIGRFDSGDLGQLRSLLKNLLTKSAGYAYFYQSLAERIEISSFSHTLQRSRTNASVYSTSHNKLLSALQQSYKEVGKFEVKKRAKLMSQKFPSERKVTISDLDYIAFLIRECFASDYDTSSAFAAVIEWLEAANDFRTYAWLIPTMFKPRQQRQQECSDKIRAAQEQLKLQLASLENAAQHKENFAKALRNEETLLSFISQSSLLIHIAKEQIVELIEIMNLFLEIDRRRPTPQIITYFTTTIQDKMKSFRSIINNDQDPSSFTKKFLEPQITSRDADALSPANIYQYLGRKLVWFYFEGVLNKELWFWIKVAGLLNVCLLPYVCRTTAAWYLNNRLIWLPITCGVSTSEYSAETLYIYVTKMLYSFFGCLSGVVGWYISCGRGKGNPYGYSVVTAVLFFFLCYYRHFAVHHTVIPAIMVSITPALVLGTSWVNTQFNKIGNVGWGIRVGYLRYVSVVIGLAIAFLASTFPKPNSSKVAVRKALANVLDEIGNVHCTVSKFAVKRVGNPHIHAFKRHDVMVEKFRSLLLSLAKVRVIMGPIQYELAFYGDWPQSKYLKLQELINDIIQLYYLIFGIIDEVKDPREWMQIMIDRTGWSNSDLCASMFSIFYMLSSSLRAKDPLPKVCQGNISMKHLDVLSDQWGIRTGSLSERFYQEPSTENEDMHELLLKNLDFDKLFSHDGQLNIVILLLTHAIYRKVDEIVLVVKGLVGEKYDFDESLLNEEVTMYKED